MEKLQIEALGILRDSEFDTTKPLIILAGPNRTGKTLLSYLMYELMGFSHMDVTDEIIEKSRDYIQNVAFNDQDVMVSNTILKSIKEFLNESFGSVDVINLISNNEESFSILKFFFHKALPDVKELFNLSEEEFKQIEVKYQGLINLEFSSKGSDKKNAKIQVNSFDNYTGDEINLGVYLIWAFLLFEMKNKSVFFIPCERMFATMVGRDLVRVEYRLSRRRNRKLPDLQSKFPVSLDDKNYEPPRYVKPLMDYLYFLNDLEYITRKESPVLISSIADFMNEKVMGGKTNWDGQVGRFSYAEELTKKDILFHLSASSVKSLTGLELYLRHQCEGNGKDILFFDEPELNLHPKAQRIMARVIARMINAGIQVVVSTHSDYIISQLSNLVALGHAYRQNPDKVKEWLETNQLDYEPDKDFLLPEQVAPYHFDIVENQEYSRATLITPTEKGFFFPSMDDAIYDLSNEINRLYGELIEQ